MKQQTAAVDTPGASVTILAHEVKAVGGMERQLTELIDGLVQAGVRVTVVGFTCELPSHTWPVRFIRIPGRARPFLLAYPWYFVAASVALLRHGRGLRHATGAIVLPRVDVATVHFCHVAARRRGVDRARSRSLHFRLYAGLAAAMSRWGERFCYRPSRTRSLVGVSEGVSREVRASFPASARRVQTIANGVDVQKFAPDDHARRDRRFRMGLAGDQPVALFVGGDWARKGLRHALEALAFASDWHLVVVGRGDGVRYLKLARERGVAERLHLVPPSSDIVGFYCCADAFVLPSSYETFSLVTYEAAACGLPLLVSRVSGVEDILVPGKNGWFVEPRAEEIATRLTQLSANPQLQHTMSAASRQAVMPYGWEAATERYLHLYSRLGLSVTELT